MPKDDKTPTAAEIALQEWEQAQARHAATVQTVEESVAALAGLNARLDDGDDTVSVDDLDRAELAIKRASRLADAQARLAAEAQARHHLASADLRLARFIIAPLVDEWLTDSRAIAPVLGRPVNVDVKLAPVGRGIADVTITASFASTTQ